MLRGLPGNEKVTWGQREYIVDEVQTKQFTSTGIFLNVVEQVIIQQKEDGEGGTRVAELEKRPSYREAIDLMKRAGMSRLGHE